MPEFRYEHGVLVQNEAELGGCRALYLGHAYGGFSDEAPCVLDVGFDVEFVCRSCGPIWTTLCPNCLSDVMWWLGPEPYHEPVIFCREPVMRHQIVSMVSMKQCGPWNGHSPSPVTKPLF